MMRCSRVRDISGVTVVVTLKQTKTRSEKNQLMTDSKIEAFPLQNDELWLIEFVIFRWGYDEGVS